ncbi:hypothetical protein A2V56_02280 [Candidatus Woesebacteria bacterium RBG_19FT_COMBO_42_9]|uniref:Bacterial toxin RNase RnlA/LsoA DBD domain-containing protein n=1 Tax=Candidatus Woesebacteria bacterium RBG_16_42_24 TaxID=1802485 RepID=A0A1F7XL66_9BACT|nr:MAG: hypothetical protein A2V97_03100 [Candidatus Woesebacteria bacterium RBG_16_42_24]OGM16953.1 MAG: hypothetical protein A2V56_02280 [Candidatus Woesebacteria bacterium RBG_19FT_COMBO_42_9]
MDVNLEEKIWWRYLHEDLQELLKESVKLYNNVGTWQERFHDYSFVVFPAAKAYEGFLKKVFLDLGFITHEDFYGKHFRVGKALNPSLDKEFRHESVYDKIVQFCHGPKLADSMWETWKSSRNLLFHWFPEERNVVSYEEAGKNIELILDTMDKTFRECKITQ